jgi:hypothetical protein
MKRFSILMCFLVVLSLFFGGRATISEKIKETGESIKDHVKDAYEKVKEKTHTPQELHRVKYFERKDGTRGVFDKEGKKKN